MLGRLRKLKGSIKLTTPRLKVDFEADRICHVRKDLVTVQGWSSDEVSNLEDKYVVAHYFDARRRRIAAMPRIVKIADDFLCPVDLMAGWHEFQEKVQKGQDINPHLSTDHESLFNRDGFLNDWGIHHFHLGTAPHPKKPAYMDRTDPLLFAFVTSGIFCAIGFLPHKGGFDDSRLLESIHRNWPDMIERHRVNGIAGEELNPEQRRALRKKNRNVVTAVSDGAAYLPLSGGVTGAGVAIGALRNADFWRDEIRVNQVAFEEQFVELMPVLINRGYAGESEIEVKLLLSEIGAQASFPKYKVLATLVNWPEWL